MLFMEIGNLQLCVRGIHLLFFKQFVCYLHIYIAGG